MISPAGMRARTAPATRTLLPASSPMPGSTSPSLVVGKTTVGVGWGRDVGDGVAVGGGVGVRVGSGVGSVSGRGSARPVK